MNPGSAFRTSFFYIDEDRTMKKCTEVQAVEISCIENNTDHSVKGERM